MKDIIIAVADVYMEKVLEALLHRVPQSSGTATYTYDIIRNPGHDSGSYNDSHELLRPFITQYKFALVLFDLEGCGAEHNKTREEISKDVGDLLNKNGWENRNEVIVIEPELENWMWIDNHHVADAIGWEDNESLYQWARNGGHIKNDKSKPDRPKETLEKALRVSRTPKSAAIYKKIAGNVSYKKCTDESFLQLISKLQEWFPAV